MSRRNQKSDEEAGAIDLTPMLDVVFIMLIFFIVTASFVKEAGVEVNRPLATEWTLKKKANILVAVTSKDEIWINKQRVDPRAVKNQIEVLLAENPKGTMVVQADNEANIKTIQEVIVAAQDLGVSNIAMSTDTK